MAKFSIFLICVMLSSTPSHTLNTIESKSQVNDGYTLDGVYYIVYESETYTNTTYAIGDTISVIRTFRFNGIIKPPSTKAYSETINNITYTGMLTLNSFTFEGENTIAVYQGTLTAIN